MIAMLNNQPIFGPRGPAGPDGNPIGTIISYMGLTAPKDYLICDGSVYNISDYSKLAEFFKTQFGSENHFGGDGTTTFAVPDMRNLFLRGYHGASGEQLSGEVGVKQEGTKHVAVSSFENNAGIAFMARCDEDTFTDTLLPKTTQGALPYSGIYPEYAMNSYYTSRPVNMAVLYCIKAAVADTYEDIYSTEEIRIGTWIDGKPLYRKGFLAMSPSGTSASSKINISNLGDINLKKWYGILTYKDNSTAIGLGYYYGGNCCAVYQNKASKTLNIIIASGTNSVYFNCPIELIIEYTKTADT